ncbi:MAG: hypothetical protein Fur0040_04020 [Sideroxydans sp.]
MNLPAQLFTADWLWLTNFGFAALLYRAARQAPWRKLLDNAGMVNALVGLSLALFVLWQFNAGIRPGFNFHLLGATLFVLMFGWQIALLALSTVMLASWLRSGPELATLGMNGLLMIVVPVLFTEWLLRLSRAHLPRNLFLFVLLNGFACAATGILLMTLATSLVLLGLTHYTWAQITYHYLIPTPILMLAEAVATGMVTTGFAVSQPDSMMNFSSKEYLDGK